MALFHFPLLLAGIIWGTEGALNFTKEPVSPTHVMKGGDAVFEWAYSEAIKTEMSNIIWLVQNKTDPSTSYILIRDNLDDTVTYNPNMPAVYVNRVEKKDQATFVIKSVTFDDSTTFSCVLKSKVGPSFDKKGSVQLVVTGPASVSPPAECADVESLFTFTCTAEGAPSQNFFWIRQGHTEKITDGPKYSVVSATGSSRLTIKNVSIDDHGYYVCNATVTMNHTNSASGHLQVPCKDPPKQDKTSCPSSSYAASIGDNQTICCPVSGYPPPVITWEKDGIPLQKGEKNVYTITNMTDKDFGNYTCTGTDIETSIGPFVIAVNKEKGELSVTFTDGTVEKAAKLNVKPQTGAENYVVKITGEEILDDFLIGTQTSLEFHYNTLVMKKAGQKPDDIDIFVDVYAMSDNAVIAYTPTSKKLTIRKPSDTKN